MTGTDVKERVDLYLGADIESETILATVNECLDAIGDRAIYYTEVAEVLSANAWHNLGEEVTKVVHVKKDNGSLYTGWQTQGNSVWVYDPGTYTITVRKMIPHIAEIGDPILIHRLFHYAILCYVRGLTKVVDDDTSEDGQLLMQKFEAEVQKAAETLLAIRQK